jgi:CRISPR-associated endonuclease Csn1
MEINILRDQVKRHLESTLVSFKAKNKVTTRNVNKSKKKQGLHRQAVETPRGQLHKETVYGKKQFYTTKLVKVGPSLDQDTIAQVAKKSHRQALLLRLHAFGGDPKKAFGGSNALSKNPIWLDEHHKDQVPEKVKLVAVDTQFTIRKSITPDLKLDKVIDGRAKRLLQERLAQFGGDAKKAFSNLEENPIWVNGKGGVQLRSVTITGVSNAEALHTKLDHHGEPLLDASGKEIPTSYVQPGSNHHVAIYRDAEGNLQERVVSFLEAVARRLQGLPIIDKQHMRNEGWTFLFTMKQNEMFVFPNHLTGFDPNAIDLLHPKNAAILMPQLFRVQKIASKNYFFRHHLETDVENRPGLNGITYQSQLGLSGIVGVQKVRLDHLGKIVHVGEY